MTAPELSCRDVMVSFGTLRVLDSVSIDVGHGEIVAIMGPSGSGKSTLLRVLAGLQPVSSGSAMKSGQLINGPTPNLRYAFQDFDSFPWLTVRRNVEIAMHDGNSRRVRELLADVGLSDFERAFPRALSGGMRKRLGLARALAADAKVVLLDEPFASLDVRSRDELHALLHRVNLRHECAFVIVTHDVDEAVFLSKRVLIGSARPLRIIQEIWCPASDLPRPADYRIASDFERTVVAIREHLGANKSAGKNGAGVF